MSRVNNFILCHFLVFRGHFSLSPLLKFLIPLRSCDCLYSFYCLCCWSVCLFSSSEFCDLSLSI